MLRHSVLCRDSGARHCVTTRLCKRNRDALSRQCGIALCHDREGHAPAIDQTDRARQGWRNKAGRARQRYYVATNFLHY